MKIIRIKCCDDCPININCTIFYGWRRGMVEGDTDKEILPNCPLEDDPNK